MLKLIQLGFSFLDENREPASNCSTWQFKLTFSLEEHDDADDTILSLRKSGAEVYRPEQAGIGTNDFAQRCTTSGISFSESVKCIVFYGTHGFGYSQKELTGQHPPQKESELFELLCMHFSSI